MVRGEFPSVRLIANQENLGFGVANNQGVAAARGRHVLLLNSDTVVPSGTVALLLAKLQEDSEVGMVGPRLVNADGSAQRSAFRFPTPTILLLEQLSLTRLLPVVRRRDVGSGRDDSLSVDWLLGACLLARRDLLQTLGPFDPRFFMYGEDIDLCYRLRATGWDIRLVPEAVITHLGGQSARRYRVQMALRSTESMYLFYRKHYSTPALFSAVLIFRGVAAMKWLRDVGRLGWFALRGSEREHIRLLLEDLGLWVRVVRLHPPPQVLPATEDYPDDSVPRRRWRCAALTSVATLRALTAGIASLP